MTFTPGRDSPPYKHTAQGGWLGSQSCEFLLWELPTCNSPLPPSANPGVSELSAGRVAPHTISPPTTCSYPWPWLMLDILSDTLAIHKTTALMSSSIVLGPFTLGKLQVAFGQNTSGSGQIAYCWPQRTNARREHSTSRSLPGCIPQMGTSAQPGLGTWI